MDAPKNTTKFPSRWTTVGAKTSFFDAKKTNPKITPLTKTPIGFEVVMCININKKACPKRAIKKFKLVSFFFSSKNFSIPPKSIPLKRISSTRTWVTKANKLIIMG